MPMIHTCTCGVKVRLPDDLGGRVFRCPKCKVEIDPVAARIKANVPVAEPVTGPVGTSIGVSCPICQTEITTTEVTFRCTACDQLHHRECWDEVGGCGTYGCERAPELDKSQPVRRPLTAWGDTKTCPACGRSIKSIALRCRYCDAEFDTVDPMTRKDLRRQREQRKQAEGLRVWVILCLILTPCLAPITLIATAAFLIPRRQLLWKAGPIYPVLTYASLILSIVICVLGLITIIISG